MTSAAVETPLSMSMVKVFSVSLKTTLTLLLPVSVNSTSTLDNLSSRLVAVSRISLLAPCGVRVTFGSAVLMRYSSRPAAEVLAVNNMSVVLTTVSDCGLDGLTPASTSTASSIPLPSVRYNSRPVAATLAVKYSLPSNTVNWSGLMPAAPAARLPSTMVTLVPSVRYSSVPSVAVVALK